MLYLASDKKLQLIPWDEKSPGFNVTALSDNEKVVMKHFTKKYLYYIGAHTGCSCGFYNNNDAYEEEERKKAFMPFQVTSLVMEAAKPDAVFMNCLPAMRGYEQTAEVIDGLQSIVFDEAENRLHIQKAIMLFLRDKF